MEWQFYPKFSWFPWHHVSWYHPDILGYVWYDHVAGWGFWQFRWQSDRKWWGKEV